jgi:hypothetical protein
VKSVIPERASAVGHAPGCLFFTRRSATRGSNGRALPGRHALVFCLALPAALLGFGVPFAVLFPFADGSAFFVDHPHLSVPAHLNLCFPAIFVGWRSRLMLRLQPCEKGATCRGCWFGPASGSVFRQRAPARVRSSPCDVGSGRSCLGLCFFRDLRTPAGALGSSRSFDRDRAEPSIPGNRFRFLSALGFAWPRLKIVSPVEIDVRLLVGPSSRSIVPR